MSEENEQTEEETPAGPRKRKVRLTLALAIQAVHARKQVGYHVDYRNIGIRFGCSSAVLRKAYCHWQQGKIDLGIDATPLEKQIDERQQHERALDLVKRHKALILGQYECALFDAEDKCSKVAKAGKGRSADRVGDFKEINGDLNFLRRELLGLIELGDRLDEGYNSFLEALRAGMHKEKPANPAIPIPAPAQTSIIRLDDRRRGLDALREMAVEPSPVPVPVGGETP